MSNEAEQVRILLAYVHAGVKVLNVRLLLLLSLLMSFGLFCWSAWDPTYNRIATAALFAGMVFFPVLRLESRRVQDQSTARSTSHEETE